MTDLSSIPIIDFVEPTTIRLISTAFISEPALAPLADSRDDLEILEAVEVLTSARHNFLAAVPAEVDPRELLSGVHGFGWSYVNAAFCYTRAGGNRFNGADRGAWYAAFGSNAAETCQAEVAFHLSRELAHVGVFDNVTSYRELLAGFVTRFYDLNGLEGKRFLHADPAIAYPAGQALARDIRRKGGNGVIYPSLRNPNGQCLAAFRPHLVQNIRLGKVWQFTWKGSEKPTISRIRDFA